MWQVTYLHRQHMLRYPHQSCHVRWAPERSQPCQVLSKSVQGFWLPEGSKSAIFLCLVLWLIITCDGSRSYAFAYAYFGENRSRNATVRVLADGQTDTPTQTDFIICPMLYAIAMGQIKTRFFRLHFYRWKCRCIFHQFLPRCM